jgi:hypothetical protein
LRGGKHSDFMLSMMQSRHAMTAQLAACSSQPWLGLFDGLQTLSALDGDAACYNK